MPVRDGGGVVGSVGGSEQHTSEVAGARAELALARRSFPAHLTRISQGSMATGSLPHVVLTRCSDRAYVVDQLRARNVSFVVYQKTGSHCNVLNNLAPHETVVLPHNRGDECAGYLRFIADRYDRLPETMAFVQMDCQKQLLDATLFGTLVAVAESVRRLGFVSLGRHSIEGGWPAPCESRFRLSRFANCSARMWHRLRGPLTPQPARVRFYAGIVLLLKDKKDPFIISILIRYFL